MAMTGVRMVTANVGLLEKSPPVAIVERYAPQRVDRFREEHRAAVIELAHWSYGALGGLLFSLLPMRMRADARMGPVYGLSVWLAFELGIAPLLGVNYPRQRRVLHRAVLAADHVLYGVVVAGRLAPAPEVVSQQAQRSGSRGRSTRSA